MILTAFEFLPRPFPLDEDAGGSSSTLGVGAAFGVGGGGAQLAPISGTGICGHEKGSVEKKNNYRTNNRIQNCALP